MRAPLHTQTQKCLSVNVRIHHSSRAAVCLPRICSSYLSSLLSSLSAPLPPPPPPILFLPFSHIRPCTIRCDMDAHFFFNLLVDIIFCMDIVLVRRRIHVIGGGYMYVLLDIIFCMDIVLVRRRIHVIGGGGYMYVLLDITFCMDIVLVRRRIHVIGGGYMYVLLDIILCMDIVLVCESMFCACSMSCVCCCAKISFTNVVGLFY